HGGRAHVNHLRALGWWWAAGLVSWAAGVTILSLVDLDQLMLPTRLVRFSGLTTAALLLGGNALSGDWRPAWQGGVSALGAGTVFGVWSFVSPRSLGFGDARMAALVSLGAGALSPAACCVMLPCACLATAATGTFLSSRQRVGSSSRRSSRAGPDLKTETAASKAVAIALGPWLALGGLASVVVALVRGGVG
ncbi:MAG TPA: hypothetical protein VED59_06975, partial [Acidimicrobiales bacterium]|nr:hypothetical protein [Acidimicrobiales bacterium]